MYRKFLYTLIFPVSSLLCLSAYSLMQKRRTKKEITFHAVRPIRKEVPIAFRRVTVLSLTRGLAWNRTTTGSLSATQECRDTNCTTRTTAKQSSGKGWKERWRVPAWEMKECFQDISRTSMRGCCFFPLRKCIFSVAATFWVAKLDFICCGFFPALASFFLPRTRFFRLRRFFPLPPECTFSAAKVLFCCCKVFFLAALNFSRGEAGFLLTFFPLRKQLFSLQGVFFRLPAASISPQVSLSLFQSPVSSGVTIKFGCLKASLLSP